MKYKVHVVPHTHFDAEVFVSREDTLDLGFSNLQTAMYLFRTDPDFTFSLDQVCYVEPYLRRHPEEMDFFRELVESGRLELVGGMQVMPDLNIPSGESFIRQVLYGRRFFEDVLGRDVKAGWTLDSFGHHPQIPQLMAKSGFEYTIFQRVMQKNGPSEFLYRGIDGTEFACHWMPAGYVGLHGAPSDLHGFKAFIEPRLRYLTAHAQTEQVLLLTGADLVAPDPSLLQMVREYNASQGEYELVFSSSEEFFSSIDWNGDIPRVTEDLNPVFQGCYSARIEIKQQNRRLESLLVDWEKADSMGRFAGIPATHEPRNSAWEKVLFNQFHDIICGSHVDATFYASMARFSQAEAEAAPALESKLRRLAAEIDTTGEGIPVVVYNTQGWTRSDVVECSVLFSDPGVFEIEVRNSAGSLVPSDLSGAERFPTGGIKKTGVVFIATDVPSFGYEVYRFLPAAGESLPATDIRTSHPLNMREDKSSGFIENAYYRVHFDLWNGVITSLYDKENDWEVLAGHPELGNTVVKERDFGNFWQYNGPCKGDAYHPTPEEYPLPDETSPGVDYSHHYLGDGNITTGRAYAQFEISHPFGSGYFATTVKLFSGIKRIDIRTTLTNNDERVRYRVVVPTSIANGTITHEIPFGAIERPVGEFPAQNWIDYSDNSRGVSLFNRGLPGNNVVNGAMMISLLKCTALKEGYEEVGGFRLGVPTERGYEKGITHAFEYALMPHSGGWKEAMSTRGAMDFNNPLIALNVPRHGGTLPRCKSFVSCSHTNLVLSCVKPVDDGVFIRLYESDGVRTDGATLYLDFPFGRVVETDLAENPLGDKATDSTKREISFNIGAFEIKTFKVYFVTDGAKGNQRETVTRRV